LQPGLLGLWIHKSSSPSSLLEILIINNNRCQNQATVLNPGGNASREEKEKYIVDIVTSLYDRKQDANKKKLGNPFVPGDFTLSSEEFNMLPHNWFKAAYVTFKRGTVPESLTQEEKEIVDDFTSDIMKELSKPMPHKSVFTGSWAQGGSRNKKRNSRSHKKSRKSHRSRSHKSRK
jgi:hypothetical protein